jgi:hypothetical protein
VGEVGRGLRNVADQKGGAQRKAKGLFLIENLDLLQIKYFNLYALTKEHVLLVFFFLTQNSKPFSYN